jgi:hypothetical protein
MSVQDVFFFLSISAQESERFNLKISPHLHTRATHADYLTVRHQGVRPACARSVWPMRMSSRVLYSSLICWYRRAHIRKEECQSLRDCRLLLVI